jgi:hypothetical protein
MTRDREAITVLPEKRLYTKVAWGRHLDAEVNFA